MSRRQPSSAWSMPAVFDTTQSRMVCNCVLEATTAPNSARKCRAFRSRADSNSSGASEGITAPPGDGVEAESRSGFKTSQAVACRHGASHGGERWPGEVLPAPSGRRSHPICRVARRTPATVVRPQTIASVSTGFSGSWWTGAPWKALPREYGSLVTCWRRLRQREEDGTILEPWRAFLAQLNDQNKVRWDFTWTRLPRASASSSKPRSTRSR